jgi:Holliday junction resolvasome RuvABC endonuclease subunit
MALKGREKHFGGVISRNATHIAIGIDQSLTGFGLSFIDMGGDSGEHSTWVYKSPYNGVQRLDDIRLWVIGKIKTSGMSGNIYDVAMEGTVLASHSALVLGELAALVKLTLWDWDKILPLQIPPMTLKKYASGKGTSKKQEMMLQIYKRWGVEINDDNAADAYSLARLAAGLSIDPIEAAIIEQVKDLKYRDSIQ